MSSIDTSVGACFPAVLPLTTFSINVSLLNIFCTISLILFTGTTTYSPTHDTQNLNSLMVSLSSHLAIFT
ncbi:MAG: hypothetical protein ACREBC_24570, partial [Pyrinomonadaceae bacterium]